jgi:hypothetical protein
MFSLQLASLLPWKTLFVLSSRSSCGQHFKDMFVLRPPFCLGQMEENMIESSNFFSIFLEIEGL